jgi:hypothetical protein
MDNKIDRVIDAIASGETPLTESMLRGSDDEESEIDAVEEAPMSPGGTT